MNLHSLAAPLLIVALASAALADQAAGEPARPVQDNSFLIEEAYNQEAGVVQHITTFTRLWASRDVTASFTQEWPLPKRARHQLSYTLTGISPGAFPSFGLGLGDIALNCRYQVYGGGDSRAAFAPRISALLPSGRASAGRGSGSLGVQLNLPLSLTVAPRWVTHWNAGATWVASARNLQGSRAGIVGYNLGQSVVYLAHPRFNALLETVWNGSEAVVAPGKTQRSHALLVSPGIRWAYNLPGGVQMVPGVAVPVGVGPSGGERGVFLYLSIEHPFGKRARP